MAVFLNSIEQSNLTQLAAMAFHFHFQLQLQYPDLERADYMLSLQLYRPRPAL